MKHYLYGFAFGQGEIDWSAWIKCRSPRWAHLDFYADDTRHFLREQSGIDHLIVDALLTDETRPRFVQIDGTGCLVILRAINCDLSTSVDEMISVRLWIDKEQVITVVKSPLVPADEIADRMRSGNGPKCIAEFVIALVKGILAHMEPVIGQIDEVTDDWEQEIPRGDNDVFFKQLSDLKRETIVLRRYLAPERDVFFQLGRVDSGIFSAQQKRQVQELHDRSLRYVEDLDVIKDRIIAIEDGLKSKMATHVNRVMYLFSLVAVIFLPLTFVTGLFGINVGGIPGAETPYGFAIFCTVTIVIAVGLIAFFKKIRWF